MTTRQYARLVGEWVASVQLQLLLGHRRVESTVRYLGIEIDDGIAEKTETWRNWACGGSALRPTIKSVETGAMYERSPFKGGHPMNT